MRAVKLEDTPAVPWDGPASRRGRLFVRALRGADLFVSVRLYDETLSEEPVGRSPDSADVHPMRRVELVQAVL